MAVTGRKKKKSDTSLSNTIRWNVNGFGPDNGLRPNSYRLLTISTLYFNRLFNRNATQRNETQTLSLSPSLSSASTLFNTNHIYAVSFRTSLITYGYDKFN
ncbi:hypothetical protein P8452_27896 [Trifolium repens]|nr:hypothetical protein P8452_27896 [Trifolium repens]